MVLILFVQVLKSLKFELKNPAATPSSECNSTSELTFDVNVCRVVQYFETEAL